MRLAAMFDFLLWSSRLTIKKLPPKINLFYRPSGGQIAKNLVEGCFLKQKKFTWTCCQTISSHRCELIFVKGKFKKKQNEKKNSKMKKRKKNCKIRPPPYPLNFSHGILHWLIRWIFSIFHAFSKRKLRSKVFFGP